VIICNHVTGGSSALKRHKQWGNSRGFTLLELMIVIVVASVLLAIAMPAWQGFGDRGKVKSAAQALAGDLAFARSESLARGTGASVSLSIVTDDALDWCYAITTNAGCDCRVEDPEEPGFCALAIADEQASRMNSSASYGGRVRLGAVTFAAVDGVPTARFDSLRSLATVGSAVFTAGRYSVQVRLGALGQVTLCSDSGLGYEPC
jgi:type IV fimbrial biogenesis protein FimT